MMLIIPNMYDYDFYLWLKEKIRRLIQISIDNNKLIKLSNLLKIDCKTALLRASNTLIIRADEQYVKILINDTVNFGNLKLIDICKYINNGSTEIQAYPILSSIFKLVQENIDTYWHIYQEG